MMRDINESSAMTEVQRSPVGCLVLLNQDSGTIKELLEQEGVLGAIEERLKGNGWEPEMRRVKGSEIDSVVKEGLDAGVKYILAGGGDGTTSSIAKLLMGSDTILGILPFGTLNLAARDLDSPLDPLDAVASLRPERSRKIDVLEVGDRVCLCVAVMGVYTKLLRMGSSFHGRSWWMKFLYLSKHFVRAFLSSAPMDVELAIGDSAKRRIRTRLLFIVPGGYVDTWGLVPEKESFELGRCVALVAKHLSLWGISKFIVRFLAGRARQDPELESFEAERIEVRVKRKRRLWLAIDGELSKHDIPVRFELKKKALRVLEPAGG